MNIKSTNITKNAQFIMFANNIDYSRLGIMRFYIKLIARILWSICFNANPSLFSSKIVSEIICDCNWDQVWVGAVGHCRQCQFTVGSISSSVILGNDRLKTQHNYSYIPILIQSWWLKVERHIFKTAKNYESFILSNNNLLNQIQLTLNFV